MPIGVGVRGLVEQTWDAFVRGYGGLTKFDAGPFETSKGPWLRPGPDQQATLTIPGWDSVIKYGVPDPNNPAVQEQNHAIARSISNSPIPDYVNSFGEIMTGIDNIRDTLAIGVLAGRLALWGLSYAELGLFGAAAGITTAEGTVIGGFAAALMPWLAPVIGALALFEMLHFLSALGVIGYATACKGPLEGAFAAIPTLLWGRGLKATVGRAARLSPWAPIQHAKDFKPGARLAPGFHNFLQAGRATAIIAGYGVLLGPVVGTMISAAFAAERAATGEPIAVDATPFSRSIQGLLRRSPMPGNRNTWRVVQSAADTLRSLPLLLRNPLLWTAEEMGMIWASAVLSMEILTPYLFGTGWQDVAVRAAASPIKPPAVWLPYSSDVVKELDPTLASVGTWPWPGNPATLTFEQLEAELLPTMGPGFEAWFLKYNQTAYGGFVGLCMTTFAEQVAYLITESRDAMQATLDPAWALTESMGLGNRIVPAGATIEEVARFGYAAIAKMGELGLQGLSPAQLDAVARSTGLRLLIRTAPVLDPSQV